MVNISIDGMYFEVPEGTTILRAAQGAGIHIPTLCDHKELSPYGGCRLCLVEVEGMRTLQPSCTLPVSNNMVVRTNTERVIAARKFVLTLIFSERNHFCPYCQVSGGDCELQNSAYEMGMTHWPLQPNWQRYEVDASHPYFVLDHNRCILCRRCVRACGELVGNFTLGFEERGANSFLIADFGTPLGQSSCISCGTCVQVCPTGALIDRISAYRGKEAQVEHHPTVCVGCSIGCGIDVLTRNNAVVRIEGNWESKVNNGVICKVGRYLPTEENRERLTTPLIRKNGKLVAATWNEALETVGKRLKPLAGKNEGGVAAAISSRLPAEVLYLFKQIFGEKMQSKMVSSLEEGHFTSVAAGLADQMGKPFEGKLADIKTADCIVTVDIDLVKEHEVASFFVKRILPQGVELVVIDTQPNSLDPLAQVTLKAAKGSSVDVIQGLYGVLNNHEKVVPGVLARIGISDANIHEAASLISKAQKPVFIIGKNYQGTSTQALSYLVDLANACKGTIINLKGEANSLAASQYRLDQSLEVEGYSAIYIAIGDEEPSQRLIQKLAKKSYLIVQSSYVSQLTALADVVLPVTVWSEQEGSYLSMDGQLQKAIKSVEPPEEVRSNLTVIQEIAETLGFKVDGKMWKDQLSQRVSTVELN